MRTNSINTYDFKVGDKVITSTGQVGIIESICDCEGCKERGFSEPRVKTIAGVGEIYITDNDKRTNFSSFYQIGKYKFGNVDKDCIEYDIKSETRKLEEATENIKKYHKQLRYIHRLEALNELEKEKK